MKALNNQRQLDVSFFKSFKARIVNKYTQLVYNFSQGLISKESVLADIKTETKLTAAQQRTEITTRINGFKQVARNGFAKAAGIDRSEYVGPLDKITRSFCAKHTGQVKTMEEWNALDNGQVSPVGIYKGGYNCRHALIGVKDGR